MNTSRLIILAVAVLAAGAAGYIALTMNDAPPPAIEVSTPAPSLPVKDVLTASSNLSVGSSLSGQLQWQSWPESSVSADYITRDAAPDALEDMQKSSLRLPILAGEPIRKIKLIGEGQQFMSSLLPKGMRAIATNIAAESSAGGFILPGDRVDVILTRANRNNTSAGVPFLTETILENVRVLAIDQTIKEDDQGKKDIIGRTATLEVTGEQAEIMAVAQSVADRISLTLRSVRDAEPDPSTTSDYLVVSPAKNGPVKMIKSGNLTEVGTN
ncbi:MAG: Flp pilus assembly protein CpaB [Brucellaceae bacterium]|jgi:pilus assembly protein CpaB|nr:Flp pilus assembly protein CpaB [Brucellaceae bacterium]